MASLSISADVSAAIDRATRKKDAVELAIQQRIDWSNQILLDRIRTNLGGKVLNIRSGALFGSAQKTPAVNSGGEIAGDVHAAGENARHGIYFELGGKGPYIIQPKNREKLLFEMNGKNIFARIVHHPAIEKKPWFAPAVTETKPEIQPGLQQAISEALAE